MLKKIKNLTLLLSLLASCLFVQAQLNEGIDALNSEMYVTAKSSFLKNLNDSLVRSNALYYLGETYRKTGNNDSALICYEMGIGGRIKNPLCMIGKSGLLMSNDATTSVLLIKEVTSSKNYKRNVEVQVALARLYTDNNDFTQAHDQLKQAKGKNPLYINTYLAEGDLLFKEKKINEAIDDYEKAIYYETGCKSAYLKIAKIYYMAKDYEKALDYIERLKIIDPHYPAAIKLTGDIYYDQGFYPEAITAYSEYLQTPETSLNDHFRYAFALFFNKEYEKTVSEIRNLQPLYPNNFVLKRIMAYISYETGNYNEALSQMENLLKSIDSKDAIATDYAYYARILTKINNDQLCEINYKKAISLSKKPEEYFKELALLYEKMKQYSNAASYWEKYVRSVPSVANSDLFIWGRNCYFAAGAIDSVTIKSNPTEAEHKKNLYLKADSIFGKVDSLSPISYLGSLWKARVNALLDPETKEGLAKPYYEKAASLLSQTAKANKKEIIEAWQYLGYYYYQKKDRERSKIYWNKILEIAPDNPIALKAIKSLK